MASKRPRPLLPPPTTTTSSTTRVLSIQSHPVHGYVGQKACTFPLQLLGVEVDPLNSCQLSNHKGYVNGAKGQVLDGHQLLEIIDGLDGNAILPLYSHVLTGYIGSVSFLRAVLQTVRRLREINPRLVYCLDPVLGDDGKFYAPQELAPVYRDEALQLATVVTPNQFEIEQITGIPIATESDAWAACEFVHSKGVKTVVITSCLANESRVMLLASTTGTSNNTSKTRYAVEIPLIPGEFGGTGDLMAGLLLAWTSRLGDDDDEDSGFARALELACATLHAVLLRTNELAASASPSASLPCNSRKSELKLIQSQDDIKTPPVERFQIKAQKRIT